MSKRKVFLNVTLSLILLVTSYALLISRARRHAESLNCACGICSICFGARQWAEDNNGLLPADFVCMSNEINTTKILVCAADRKRWPATNWAKLTLDNCSYDLLSPGLPATNSDTAILRCTVHGHVGYLDGTVFDGVSRRNKYD